MGKSIRSKIKRKHRAEFRATIGTEAYKKNMEKVQAKLKDSIEKQSLKSIDRLSDILGTTDEAAETSAMQEDGGTPAIDASETIVGDIDVSKVKGENKVPVSKRGRRRMKHTLKAAAKKEEVKQKRKPKFFCQF